MPRPTRSDMMRRRLADEADDGSVPPRRPARAPKEERADSSQHARAKQQALILGARQCPRLPAVGRRHRADAEPDHAAYLAADDDGHIELCFREATATAGRNGCSRFSGDEAPQADASIGMGLLQSHDIIFFISQRDMPAFAFRHSREAGRAP